MRLAVSLAAHQLEAATISSLAPTRTQSQDEMRPLKAADELLCRDAPVHASWLICLVKDSWTIQEDEAEGVIWPDSDSHRHLGAGVHVRGFFCSERELSLRGDAVVMLCSTEEGRTTEGARGGGGRGG